MSTSRRFKLFVAALCLGPVVCSGTDAHLSWGAVTTYDDGSKLPAAPTYNVYGGNCGEVLQFKLNTKETTAVRTNVSGTRLCYAVSAVVAGVESPQSPQAVLIVPAGTPSPPPKLATVPATPGAPTVTAQ